MKLKISVKLIVSILFFIVVGGVVLQSLYISRKVEEKVLNQSISVITNLFKENLRFSLVRGQYHEAYKKCKEVVENDLVLGVQVVDYDEKEICKLGSEFVRSSLNTQDLFFDQHGNELLAHVSLNFNRNYYRSFMTTTIVSIFLFVSVIAIFLGGLLNRFFHTVFLPFTTDLTFGKGDLIDKCFLRPLEKYSMIHEVESVRSLLTRFVVELNEKQEQLLKHSRKQARYEMSRQVAHDLYSPLAVLQEVVKNKTNLNKESMIGMAVERLEGIVLSLLPEKSNGNLSNYSGDSLVEKICIEKRAQYPSLKLHANLQSKAEICVDAVEFLRVLSNLIDNAVHSVGERGIVGLSTKLRGKDCFLLEVCDNGKGIPSENLEKVFEKGASFGKNNGTGLGLFHARENVERWKGRIFVKSKIGCGATFSIVLPTSSD